jgi:indole-3-glycerol phosphate synthase
LTKTRSHSQEINHPCCTTESSIFFEKDDSLRTNLINSTSGIIAEHKRRSPSKAEINYSFTVEEVTKGYEDAGACEFRY